jgi:hypothetical protein
VAKNLKTLLTKDTVKLFTLLPPIASGALVALMPAELVGLYITVLSFAAVVMVHLWSVRYEGAI